MAFFSSRVLLPALLAVATGAAAQPGANGAGDRCAARKQGALQCAKITVASPEEDRYDVRWAHLDLRLDNTSTSVSGSVTTQAVAGAALPAYVFELNPQLTLDSVRLNGAAALFRSDGYIRTALLPVGLGAGQAFTAQVWYHGTVTGGTGFLSVGLNNATSTTWPTRVTYTLSEPYDARDWWPCKQSLRDKLDSVRVWITVPQGLMAGSNGRLAAVTPVDGGAGRRYEWTHRHPIDYYLVSATVAPYVDYSFYAPIGPGDSVLVQNFVYDHPEALPFWKDRIDSTRDMLGHFSQLFGRYPFADEKYGHCLAPFSGGMEHLTMTTINSFDPTLVAHELAHQWWGDHITCGSWGDLWLNEGFATYAEYLFVDRFRGPAAGAAYLRDIHTKVTTAPQTGAPLDSGTVFVADTADERRLFSSRLTYAKGASVLHMLRFLAGSDARFFAGLHAYREAFGGGTAVTADLKAVLERSWNLDLGTFFRQWVYGEGYPRFRAEWQATGGVVSLRLTQAGTVPGSVGAFSTPVEIRIAGPASDTTVQVWSTGGTQDFRFVWAAPVTTLRIDPNDWLLKRIDAVVQNPALAPDTATGAPWLVYPNPARTAWTVSGLLVGTSLRLLDLTGGSLWQGTADASSLTLPAGSLPAGLYLLQVRAPDGASGTLKLLRD